MTLLITPLYAAILGLMLIGFTFVVIAGRASTGVLLLHGDNLPLAARIRQHANFAENVPMALLLMALAEISGAPAGWMHAMGLLLILSRLLHPFGVNPEGNAKAMRIAGMTGTWLVMLTAIVLILGTYL